MSSDMVTMDIGPTPDILQAMRAKSHSWPIILGELIDNSLDAGATQIRVHFEGNNTVTITDNGNGCDSIQAMLRMGTHRQQKTTRLGRYGVGLKEAACCLWGGISIDTVHNGTLRSFILRWDSLARQTDWKIAPPKEQPARLATGTVIRFDDISKKYPSDYNRLVDDVAYMFSPGIRNGAQIVFDFPQRKNVVCKAPEPPPCEPNLIDKVIIVRGKAARVRCGIIQSGYTNKRIGFCYTHHHRVIIETVEGSGGLSMKHIWGTVDLTDAKWRLSTNKECVIADFDPLCEAVFTLCRPLLEESHRRYSQNASTELTNNLASKMQTALDSLTKRHKAKRSPRVNHTGTVRPTGLGSPHMRARIIQPGDTLNMMSQIGALAIDWRDLDGDTLGQVDRGGRQVSLNENNPWLISMRDTGNENALRLVCWSMWVNHYLSANPSQKVLPGLCDPDQDSESKFNQMLSRLMNATGESTQESK